MGRALLLLLLLSGPAAADEAARRRFERAMEQPVALRATDRPLRDVLREVFRDAEVGLVVEDAPAYHNKLSLSLDGMQRRIVLRLIASLDPRVEQRQLDGVVVFGWKGQPDAGLVRQPGFGQALAAHLPGARGAARAALLRLARRALDASRGTSDWRVALVVAIVEAGGKAPAGWRRDASALADALGGPADNLPGATEQQRREIAALIERLGSERYRQREQATRRIEALGWRARPQLLATRHHPDLETRSRVADLLRRHAPLEFRLVLQELTAAAGPQITLRSLLGGPLPAGRVLTARVAGQGRRLVRLVTDPRREGQATLSGVETLAVGSRLALVLRRP